MRSRADVTPPDGEPGECCSKTEDLLRPIPFDGIDEILELE
jgi:hypothetical protein